MNRTRLPLETPAAGLEPGFASLPAFLQPQAGADLLTGIADTAVSAAKLAGDLAAGATDAAMSSLPGGADEMH